MSEISPFIVGKSRDTRFSIIQNAIEAAYKAGGGAVYIQPGIYKENLNLYDQIDLCGVGGIADCQSCTIIGSHTPPVTGNISIRNLSLKSNNSIFCSTDPGTSSIFLNSCFVGVKNGFVFDLPNWKLPGKFVCFDLGDTDSIDNGFIKNHQGASSLLIAATIGQGSKSMILSGETNFFTVQSRCPIVLEHDAKAFFLSGCCIEKTMHLKDTSTINVMNSSFRTQEFPALINNSSEYSMLSEVFIDCSGKLTIDGRGTLTIGSITTIHPFNLAETLKVSYGNVFTGNVYLPEKGKGLHIAEGGNSTMGIVKLTAGAAFVSTNRISNNSRIFLTIQEVQGDAGFVFIAEKTVGKGFKILSSNSLDSSEVAWLIVEGI